MASVEGVLGNGSRPKTDAQVVDRRRRSWLKYLCVCGISQTYVAQNGHEQPASAQMLARRAAGTPSSGAAPASDPADSQAGLSTAILLTIRAESRVPDDDVAVACVDSHLADSVGGKMEPPYGSPLMSTLTFTVHPSHPAIRHSSCANVEMDATTALPSGGTAAAYQYCHSSYAINTPVLPQSTSNSLPQMPSPVQHGTYIDLPTVACIPAPLSPLPLTQPAHGDGAAAEGPPAHSPIGTGSGGAGEKPRRPASPAGMRVLSPFPALVSQAQEDGRSSPGVSARGIKAAISSGAARAVGFGAGVGSGMGAGSGPLYTSLDCKCVSTKSLTMNSWRREETLGGPGPGPPPSSTHADDTSGGGVHSSTSAPLPVPHINPRRFPPRSSSPAWTTESREVGRWDLQELPPVEAPGNQPPQFVGPQDHGSDYGTVGTDRGTAEASPFVVGAPVVVEPVTAAAIAAGYGGAMPYDRHGHSADYGYSAAHGLGYGGGEPGVAPDGRSARLLARAFHHTSLPYGTGASTGPVGGASMPQAILPSPARSGVGVMPSHVSLSGAGSVFSLPIETASLCDVTTPQTGLVAEQTALEMCALAPALDLWAAGAHVSPQSRIAQGAYGVVYRGTWHGCTCAVKVMLAASTENLSSQLTEVFLCKALSCHPNIVQTFDCNVWRITAGTLAAVQTFCGVCGGGGAPEIAGGGSLVGSQYGSQQFCSQQYGSHVSLLTAGGGTGPGARGVGAASGGGYVAPQSSVAALAEGAAFDTCQLRADGPTSLGIPSSTGASPACCGHGVRSAANTSGACPGPSEAEAMLAAADGDRTTAGSGRGGPWPAPVVGVPVPVVPAPGGVLGSLGPLMGVAVTGLHTVTTQRASHCTAVSSPAYSAADASVRQPSGSAFTETWSLSVGRQCNTPPGTAATASALLSESTMAGPVAGAGMTAGAAWAPLGPSGGSGGGGGTSQAWPLSPLLAPSTAVAGPFLPGLVSRHRSLPVGTSASQVASVPVSLAPPSTTVAAAARPPAPLANTLSLARMLVPVSEERMSGGCGTGSTSRALTHVNSLNAHNTQGNSCSSGPGPSAVGSGGGACSRCVEGQEERCAACGRQPGSGTGSGAVQTAGRGHTACQRSASAIAAIPGPTCSASQSALVAHNQTSFVAGRVPSFEARSLPALSSIDETSTQQSAAGLSALDYLLAHIQGAMVANPASVDGGQQQQQHYVPSLGGGSDSVAGTPRAGAGGGSASSTAAAAAAAASAQSFTTSPFSGLHIPAAGSGGGGDSSDVGGGAVSRLPSSSTGRHFMDGRFPSPDVATRGPSPVPTALSRCQSRSVCPAAVAPTPGPTYLAAGGAGPGGALNAAMLTTALGAGVGFCYVPMGLGPMGLPAGVGLGHGTGLNNSSPVSSSVLARSMQPGSASGASRMLSGRGYHVSSSIVMGPLAGGGSFGGLGPGLTTPGMLPARSAVATGDEGDAVDAWAGARNLAQVLSLLGAREGQLAVLLVMEECDRGSLQQLLSKSAAAAAAAAIAWGGGAAAAAATGVAAGGRVDGLYVPFSGGGRYTPQAALRALVSTAKEIALGMAFLHVNNIIHGDLKPGNVLLKSSRQDQRGFIVKISDFGLSRVMHPADPPPGRFPPGSDGDNNGGGMGRPSGVGQEGEEGSGVYGGLDGTVPYLAPELFESGQRSKASDVWAYGVLLWQLITGKRPYEGYMDVQIMAALCGPPSSDGEERLQWPPDAHLALVQLGRACLSHYPRERPSFAQVVRRLQALENEFRA